MIKVGIIGGSGYTGGELLRILLHHPYVEINFVYSTSKAGIPIAQIHQDLIGNTEIMFTDKVNLAVDVVFLCIGHGKSKEFLKTHKFNEASKIIDLSTDFRIASSGHSFVYGLPEVNKKAIRQANFIANPGCFATAINLALYPLVQKFPINDIHIHAITGATGAGARLGETTHYAWRANNYSTYKVFQHQHETEILQLLSGKRTAPKLHFIPARGSFPRGIYATCYLDYSDNINEVRDLYESAYAESPFTHLSLTELHLKQVTNTNYCLVHLQYIDGKLIITSIIDNLLKGASGQAVQNMNLMFGFEETTGLQLKGNYF